MLMQRAQQPMREDAEVVVAVPVEVPSEAATCSTRTYEHLFDTRWHGTCAPWTMQEPKAPTGRCSSSCGALRGAGGHLQADMLFEKMYEDAKKPQSDLEEAFLTSKLAGDTFNNVVKGAVDGKDCCVM